MVIVQKGSFSIYEGRGQEREREGGMEEWREIVGGEGRWREWE